MILDEKVLSPPPPYTKAPSPPPGSAWRTLSALPPHLLLQIVYATFSEAYDIEDAKEQRKTLYWLAVGLRLVNRVFYSTSMNVLRSIYLPLYDSLIRPPYTSDPFPFAHSHTSPSPHALKSPFSSHTQISSITQSLQRETHILDLFIALKVREDVWADDSDLHLSRAESTFTDLFSLLMPRARLEDLVREYGVAEGVLYIDRRRSGVRTPGASSVDLRANGEREGPTNVVLRSAASYAALTQRIAASTLSSSSSGSSFWRSLGGKGKARAPAPPTPVPSQKVTIHPLPFSAISASFSSRRVGLVLTSSGGGGGSGWLSPGGSSGSKRTIVEVARTRDEALEVAARRLVWELRDWLVDGVDGV
ncbi:hypothetical protein K438DRAFT_1813875 [Mycena galopus ATCC 62051]|nr:hypothetical protein K438DRAFT_1813875 [Mycena galopus ATCC 62051]